jgi:hypothetical protein
MLIATHTGLGRCLIVVLMVVLVVEIADPSALWCWDDFLQETGLG